LKQGLPPLLPLFQYPLSFFPVLSHTLKTQGFQASEPPLPYIRQIALQSVLKQQQESQINLFWQNALPEPDLRYFSNAKALYFS